MSPASDAVNSLSSLMELLDGVTCYLGRWRIVRYRLDKLASQLKSLADRGSSSNCEDEILECVMATIARASQLASRSISGRDCEGKLQMQSKLDALAAALSTHTGDCELLLKNRDASSRLECKGILNREIVRWSVRDLLTRMQIRSGDPRSKQRALDSVVELMNRNDGDALVVASQGGVPILVQLLDPSLPIELREAAAAGVCALARAGGGVCEVELVAQGAIAPLVRLLESGTPPAKEHAAAALYHLSSYSPHNARALAALGAISSCIALSTAATPGGAWAAAGCIRNLALVDAPVAAAAIPALVGLLRSGTPAAQECAAAALYNLTCADTGGAAAAAARRRICDSGGVPALVRFVESGQATATAAKLAAGVLQSIGASEESSNKKLVPGRKKMTLAAALVALLKNSTGKGSRSGGGGGGGGVSLPPWLRKLVDSSRESSSASSSSRKSSGKLRIPKAFLS